MKHLFAMNTLSACKVLRICSYQLLLVQMTEYTPIIFTFAELSLDFQGILMRERERESLNILCTLQYIDNSIANLVIRMPERIRQLSEVSNFDLRIIK